MQKNIIKHNKLVLVVVMGLVISFTIPNIYNAGIISISNKGMLLKTSSLKVDKKIVTPSSDDINLIEEENTEVLTRGAIGKEEQIISFAKEQLGKKYVWGAVGDNVFDTIGLIKYVYGKFGLEISNDIKEQYNVGTELDWESLNSGDLVFFQNEKDIDHIGIYIGNGDFIHATTNGVIISSLLDGYYSDTYIGARRIIE